jgi:D-alanyl-D-alanine carboxypeptidase
LQEQRSEQLSAYCERASYLKLLADGILADPAGPSIFDVSPLVQKLPRGYPLWDFRLDQLVMPVSDTIFIDFGLQAFLRIGKEHDLHFEGAYVEQMDNGETSRFMVYLVCADPDFGRQQQHMLSLARIANTIQIEISPESTILESVQRCFLRQDYWADPNIQCDAKAIAAALDLTVRSMIYLGTAEPDMQVSGNSTVVGQNIEKIEVLDVPTRANRAIPSPFKVS